MTTFSMSDYLSAVSAGYTATEMTISPQEQIVELGQKVQKIRLADDGTEERVTLDDDPHFVVRFEWRGLSESDIGTILDFYFDASKANGFENTFYWYNPADGETYTVRFASEISRDIAFNVWSLSQIALKVIGLKP